MCLTVDLRGLWALTGAQTREPPDRNFPGGPPASPVAEQGVGHLEPSRPVGGKARAVVGKCSAISLDAAEFSKFAGILRAALSQHHLSGFGIAQLEFYHLH